MKPLEKLQLLEQIATALQARMTTSDINALLRSLGIAQGLQNTVTSKRLYAKEQLANLDDEKLVALAHDLELVPATTVAAEDPKPVNRRTTVFVIHGRNERLRAEFFSFLRAAGLDPLEWSEAVRLTGKGAPYIGEILDHAFAEAAAVVVLLTPDDEVRLAPDLAGERESALETTFQRQARPNVLFEAGMAFGRYPDRTILVAIGQPKPFSDVAGRHVIYLTNDASRRMDLLGRLETAGCTVRTTDRRDWLTTGDFDVTFPGFTAAGQPVAEPDLSETEVAVLQFLVGVPDGAQAILVAEQLEITVVAAEYYLEELEAREYVFSRLSTGRPAIYLLDQKGRGFLVREGLA